MTDDRVSVLIVGAEEAVRPTRKASAGSSGDLPAAFAPDELDSIDELVAMDEDVCSVCPSDDSDEDSVSDELSEEVASSDNECGPTKPTGHPSKPVTRVILPDPFLGSPFHACDSSSSSGHPYRPVPRVTLPDTRLILLLLRQIRQQFDRQSTLH